MKLMAQLMMVFLIIGMMSSCKSNDKKTTAKEAGTVAVSTGETYRVNPSTAKVLWTGKKVNGQHNGHVNISDGTLVFTDETLTSGNFTIDMSSITVEDLDGEYKDNLEAHLKGLSEEKQDHFFNVTTYPTAKFEITKATKLMNNPDGNYVVNGNLTIKGVTKEVSFKANVNRTGDRVTVTTPEFEIDRTDFGVNYNSAKIFDGIKDKAIDDEMYLSVNFTATK